VENEERRKKKIDVKREIGMQKRMMAAEKTLRSTHPGTPGREKIDDEVDVLAGDSGEKR